MNRKTLLSTLSLSAVLTVTACAELAAPYGSGSGGYYDPYGGSQYDDSYYHRREEERAREARQDYERERDRLEDERRRLEEQRQRETYKPPPPPPPPRAEEHCPAGFSPSEDKCSPQERKHGCKDIRLPGGLGCVSR